VAKMYRGFFNLCRLWMYVRSNSGANLNNGREVAREYSVWKSADLNCEKFGEYDVVSL
jgi:hypothetical protein